MYRVLLVDDEIEIRSGLKLKIDWAGHRFEVSGEAQDGREALALLEQHRYDLVLTDIRMPIMSGLELLKQCAENYPRVKVIVLSGYDDFHFVKAALQCGARDYLLKPVVRSELTSILAKLREELDSEREAESRHDTVQHQLSESRTILREQLLMEWIGNDEEERVPELKREAGRLAMDPWMEDDLNMQFINVEYRVPEGRFEQHPEGGGLFRLAFQLLCRETAQQFEWKDSVFAFYYRGYPQMMHFLVSAPDLGEGELRKEALGKQIQSHIHRYLRVEAVVGIGEPFLGASSIRQGFLSAMLAWSQSQSGVVSQIVSSEPSPETFAEIFPDVEKRLSLALENADLESFSGTVEAVVLAGRYPLQGVASFVLRVILLLDQAARRHRLVIPETQEWMFPDTAWHQHRNGASALPYLTGIASQVIEGIRSTRVSGGVSAVEAIRRYIEQSYMNELSLTLLADRFHLNATYLSELFKKQTGTTFSDYLTQVRIGKAAELLRDPQMRLSDIAELVGFANASYLSSVFKKHYGVSPNDYRNHPVAPS
ncbi:response regulator transcription factor [Cohnella herbarum]|uniref:Response regulator n=1 Tax=Cohnella herbarum TaxID=2728023 RepID=A0A7Z2VQA2_9BACL|nr:response regulator [Cohnella herbarum]QJD87130.1 response regulator [Cohnella herbarum]